MSVKSLSKEHSFPTLLNARILAMFAVSVLSGSFANIPNILYGLCAIAFILMTNVKTCLFTSDSTSKSFISTSRSLAISKKVSILGCVVLVHHFDTVAGSLPSVSANHLLVFSFSTRTSFNLLTFAIAPCPLLPAP